MKRALVLGGGGAVGVAWEIGVVAGLLEGGLDTREADLIIGTSAGSVVGAQLAHGRDPRELFESVQSGDGSSPPSAGLPPDQDALRNIFTLWGSVDRMTDEIAAQIGKMALAAKTATEEQMLVGQSRLGITEWPAKPLLVTAVDCASGAMTAFEGATGAPVERAIAASCAVPGMFPPITIDGRRYTDGGVRSFTSADLAQRIEPDIVLIVAVFGVRDRGIDRLAAHQIAEESAQLESAGASVRAVRLDEATLEASGGNFMDFAKRAPAAVSGRRQGLEAAAELAAWWSGA